MFILCFCAVADHSSSLTLAAQRREVVRNGWRDREMEADRARKRGRVALSQSNTCMEAKTRSASQQAEQRE